MKQAGFINTEVDRRMEFAGVRNTEVPKGMNMLHQHWEACEIQKSECMKVLEPLAEIS